jgi:hypothetical protein
MFTSCEFYQHILMTFCKVSACQLSNDKNAKIVQNFEPIISLKDEMTDISKQKNAVRLNKLTILETCNVHGLEHNEKETVSDMNAQNANFRNCARNSSKHASPMPNPRGKNQN